MSPTKDFSPTPTRKNEEEKAECTDASQEIPEAEDPDLDDSIEDEDEDAVSLLHGEVTSLTDPDQTCGDEDKEPATLEEKPTEEKDMTKADASKQRSIEKGIQCSPAVDESKQKPSEKQAGKKAKKTGVIIGATVGAVVGLAGTAVAVPVVVGALGFTSAGIAAGSIGASMMSTAATTGVGMGVVSVLQSVGAAGLSGATYVAATVGGGAVGTAVGKVADFFKKRKGPKSE